MSTNDHWLDLGLDAEPTQRAQRIRLLRALFATAAAFRSQLDRALAPSGITSQQAGMLQLIEAQPHAPTISFVAQTMGMTHQNVKQIALSLQAKGFIEIATDAADRRARRLILTDHHHRFWRQRNPGDFSSVEEWTGGLSDDEISATLQLLRKLRSELKALQSKEEGKEEGKP